MNRSLILVMCDVLVLSAMSLSSGAFDDFKDGGTRNDVPETQSDSVVQMSVEPPLVATNALSEISAQQVELAAAVSNLAYQLNCATSELAKTAQNFGAATNDVVRLRKLADSYSNEVARTMLDVEAAREQAKKSETERVRAEAERKSAEEARRRAETERKSAEEARRKAEEEAGVANSNLAAAREEAQTLAAVRDKAEAARKSAEEARRKAEEETEVVKSNLAAAREEAQALATARDKAESERKQAMEQGEEWKMKYDGVYREYALPELERKKRIDTIRHSIVEVWIEKTNGEKERLFSPVVAIGTSRFVLALRDKGDLKKVKKVSFRSRVLPGESGTVVGGETAYVFRMRVDDTRRKCAFFPIDAQGLPCLTLGVREGSDMKHIIRPSDGDIRAASLVTDSAWQNVKKILGCKAGDFVIDEASAAIEKIFYFVGVEVMSFPRPLTLNDLGDAHLIGQE